MTSFYRGTTSEQVSYFTDKIEMSINRESGWPECFQKEIRLENIDLNRLERWLYDFIIDIQGKSDDILTLFIIEQLSVSHYSSHSNNNFFFYFCSGLSFKTPLQIRSKPISCRSIRL